jgi:beta-lactamase regulating signal transducer with metallopeptidase domain
MFAVRGIAVSLSIFVVIYGVFSLAVLLAWRKVWLWGQSYAARRCADLLFILRTSPFAAAAAVTLVFAVPSFLLLEPRTADEPIGWAPLILGCCGIAVIVAGVWKASAALLRASENIARWSSQAKAGACSPIDSRNSVTVRRISGPIPPLTAAGILRPSIWLSSTAEFVLNERELQTALRHEGVHVRRLDNLRKLVLRIVAFPGMAELESAWREAAEMAADDAAVSNAAEALDLAAAVIKLSTLPPLQPPGELMTALVHTPLESVNARVARLIAWEERRQNPIPGSSLRYAVFAAVALVAALAVSYSHMLSGMHAATEWLVR